MLLDLNSFIWVSDFKILGAQYSAVATLPIAANSLSSDLNGKISGGSGFGDAYFIPLILGWNRERLSVRLMAGILAPTGRYSANANNNVGNGYWSPTLSSGQTLRILDGGRLTFSAFEMYEFHTTQEGTGIRPGGNVDLDYSLMTSLARTDALAVQVGLVGYEQRQTAARPGRGLRFGQIVRPLRRQRPRPGGDGDGAEAKTQFRRQALQGVREPIDIPGLFHCEAQAGVSF